MGDFPVSSDMSAVKFKFVTLISSHSSVIATSLIACSLVIRFVVFSVFLSTIIFRFSSCIDISRHSSFSARARSDWREDGP